MRVKPCVRAVLVAVPPGCDSHALSTRVERTTACLTSTAHLTSAPLAGLLVDAETELFKLQAAGLEEREGLEIRRMSDEPLTWCFPQWGRAPRSQGGLLRSPKAPFARPFGFPVGSRAVEALVRAAVIPSDLANNISLRRIDAVLQQLFFIFASLAYPENKRTEHGKHQNFTSTARDLTGSGPVGILALLVDAREARTKEDKDAKKTEILLSNAGLSVDDIVALTGKKADAVRKTIQRGRKK